MSTLHEKSSIWVFRVGSLGDALVALPAISKVRRCHSDAKITLLTNAGRPGVVNAGDILQHSNAIDRVIRYTESSKASLLSLIARMRLERPGVMYYFAPTRSDEQIARDETFFARLGGIREIRGLTSRAAWARPNDTQRVERVERESDRLLKIVPEADASLMPSGQRYLHVPSSAKTSGDRLLDLGGWDRHRPLVAMVPGSKMESKRWPVDRFRAVIQSLLAAHCTVVVLGSTDEADLAKDLCAHFSSGVLNLAGKTSLMEAAAILEHCVAYVGNDTGTMHLAAAMGVPCVALFSARDLPGKWEPYGTAHRILRVDTACAGCMLEVCDRDLECLTRIGVDRVLQELAAVLPPTIALPPVRATP